METTISLSSTSIRFYMNARRWTSDLEFFKVETAFFYHLLNDYFVGVVDPAPMEAMKLMVSKLSKLEADEHLAIKSLGTQLKQLELVSENIIPENLDALGSKHVELETLMAKLNKEYFAVKKELFTLVESAVRDIRFSGN